MKAIVLFSGGLDSTVLLYRAKEQLGEVAAISFDYGQRHRRELNFASETCGKLDIPRMVVQVQGRRADDHYDLIGRLFDGSSQTDKFISVPEGHYEEPSMKLTFVPNRNMVMLSIASAWAIANKVPTVLYAAHRGDHAIYPDCRPEFVTALEKAVNIGNYEKVIIASPFITWSKSQIVEEGARLKVPFADTWSCYTEGSEHCGKCGTCVERREAFDLARVNDPTVYA